MKTDKSAKHAQDVAQRRPRATSWDGLMASLERFPADFVDRAISLPIRH